MSKLDNYDYMVLCTDMGAFMMKSECEENGYDYIDFVGDMVQDFDDTEEIESILFGE